MRIKQSWTLTPWGAQALANDTERFYISYRNKSLGADSSETALCWTDKEQKNHYLILDGDWRNEYEERIESFEKCKEFYEMNKNDFRSFWSSDKD